MRKIIQYDWRRRWTKEVEPSLDLPPMRASIMTYSEAGVRNIRGEEVFTVQGMSLGGRPTHANTLTSQIEDVPVAALSVERAMLAK
jgi:hypothetical protein